MTLTEFLTARLDEEEAAIRADTTDTGRWEWAPFSRARLLAKVDAQRRIMEAAQSAVDAATGLTAYEPIAFAMLGTLSLLALPYADHPDYREEWRP